MITFCRVRPAAGVNEVWATTRRREGTNVLELEVLGSADRAGALAGGVLPVAGPADGAEPAAWLVSAAQALELASKGVPGWRLTIVDSGQREEVLDALARSGAAFLRTKRSTVADAAMLVGLPAIDARASVFVDSVEDAVDACRSGAGDLLLRDWDTESIGALRDVLAPDRLVERSAFPVGLTVDEARSHLDADLLKTYLDQVDGSGAARPRYEWAPGRDMAAPVPEGRLSAAWPDRGWLNGPGDSGLAGLDPELRATLERSLGGLAPNTGELVRLFGARGIEVEAIAAVADQLRARTNGDTVTYVVNRNINYTNQCYFRCGFCAFSKGPRSLNLRGDPYLLEIHEVAFRAKEARERGATEVCLQGGIHPNFTGDFYLSVLKAIKDTVPDMHVHGFTPLEVWQGAETLGMSVRDFLVQLRDAGLGTLPGTAAEILDDDVREHLCPDKIRTSQWAEVMITAHELGMRSTSTMMFGHIDGPQSWANHLEVLRHIQRRTGGITEFVPLPFVHMGAPIYLRGESRPGPTWDEVVLIHAVARIALDGLIPNIQASWVKLGLAAGARLLDAGCNDLGGTLMDENISRAAGAAHGQMATAEELESAITAARRIPSQRNTVYEPVAVGQQVGEQ
ncbi:MAG: 5-amino-6-(D-ribitylamino)uracil--L-tyrosine 4-hydroxyphenyl transferase CofH [Acidimicrobiia bacterium]|nr:5-amino-6-(D-ribitylamino)uracil--L-tyrosine 4-hydroxyphenyl transferase CofH [Acidimicrobiia bacterium]